MNSTACAELGTYLTAADLSRIFGICRSGIWALMRRGDFPLGVKIGRSRRWAVSEVKEWMSRQKEKGGEQLAEQGR